MKGRMVLVALMLSVCLVSQGFGLGLLDNLLGTNRGCSNACCEPQCCEKACAPQACEKACAPACAPQSCEPACCEPSCNTCCKPKCDLFAGLKGLFACKKCCASACCEPACNACCETKCCAPEPKCCEPQNCCEKACEPACCEPNCCEPCCKKVHCTPVRDFLDDLCSLRICVYKAPKCGSCCEPVGCCEATGCGGVSIPATAPITAEEAAPLPKAPTADPSASMRTNNYYKASRTIVRN